MKYPLPKTPWKLFMCAVCVAAVPLAGAEISWNAENGLFSDSGNWSGGVVPGSGDHALFETDGSYDVSLDQDTTLQGLRLTTGGSKVVTLDLGGNELTTTSATAGTPGLGIYGANGISRVLQLRNGTFSSGIVRINGGSASTNHGKLDIGAGGIFRTMSDDSRIGNSGHGVIEVHSGGVWENHGGSVRIGVFEGTHGLVVVRGSGSNWVNNSSGNVRAVDIGQSGNGRVEILDGGKASGMNLFFGRAAGASGELLVDGTGSTIEGNSIHIGGTGGTAGQAEGQIEIRNGGLMRFRAMVFNKGSIHLDKGKLELIGTSNSTFSSDALLDIVLHDTVSEWIVVNGVELDNTQLQLSLNSGFSATIGDTITLMRYNQTFSGTFNGISEGDVISVGDYEFQLSYGAGSDSAVTLEVTAIPEPGMAALIVVLLLGLGVRFTVSRRGKA